MNGSFWEFAAEGTVLLILVLLAGCGIGELTFWLEKKIGRRKQ